jgi:hypothetical protein
MSYEKLLNLTCTIKEKTSTQSNSGATTLSWTDKAIGVKTRKVRNNTPTIYDDLAHTYIDDYKLYFLLGTNIEKDNKVVFANGEEFEVLSVGTDSQEHHIKVFAKKTSQ